MPRAKRATIASLLTLALASGCGGRHEAVAVSRPHAAASAPDALEDDTLPARTTYAGSEACKECHEEKYERWSKDWHARALSPARPEYVVGNFAHAHFQGASSEAWMDRHGADYTMRTRDAAGKLGTFPVAWVIGGKRMQDTVTEFPDGRWQVLPVYFHVTGGGEWVDYNEKKQGVVTPSHPFFWTNFRRTANRECLECHTTGLDVRYDEKTHHWSTDFADPGVACEACHGPAARHAETKSKGDIVRPGHIDKELALAICANCHGPRDPIYPALDPRHRFHPGDRYDEHYQPLVIVDGDERSGEFFADGRPSSSSFEYQALLQSRCYLRGGATCLTCHTAPHQDHGHDDLRKLKTPVTIEDAGCRTCHANVFAAGAAHTHHSDAAAQSCVSCHMPKILSGVLDKFADHTIDVPNPPVTAAHGVPNACAVCHEKTSPAELQSAMERWWPGVASRQQRRLRLASAIDEKTRETSLGALRAVVYDRDEAPSLRGAAAILLAQRFPAAAAAISPLLDDPSPLVRSRFIEALGHARARESAAAVAARLDDPAVAVRQMSALVLASFGDSRGFAALEKLARDPKTAALVRPHIMLANRDAGQGDFAGATRELDAAVAEMPYLADARVMLADIAVRQGKADEARRQLEEALRFSPDHAGAKKRLALMSGAAQ